ncbi:cellulose binding domain-containing protein [Phytohabitans sp. ZYX-F-186]|uniref:Cellulose binding domain-containing protein n=1 Tax=Phytohabitans maris TaxID=3071409 RepID=A0ABU0ZDE4_9ACTN|nr:cellulose binding domain-containing protein [Phytohabitans sp. ZYX-F-186]MDQ7905068.1 cellulose binding domain-containing protein [Phytohabitans sp. ZYX-F-186]
MTVRAGTAALNGWTVGWSFADGQRITQIWSGTATSDGANVSVRDAGYNGGCRPAAAPRSASWRAGPAPTRYPPRSPAPARRPAAGRVRAGPPGTGQLNAK